MGMSLEIDNDSGQLFHMAENTHQRVHKAGRSLPLAVPVQVQGNGFRCLAYRDESGDWIDYYSGERLKGEVKVVEYRPD